MRKKCWWSLQLKKFSKAFSMFTRQDIWVLNYCKLISNFAYQNKQQYYWSYFNYSDSNNNEKHTIGMNMIVIHLNFGYSLWFAFKVTYATATWTAIHRCTGWENKSFTIRWSRKMNQCWANFAKPFWMILN